MTYKEKRAFVNNVQAYSVRQEEQREIWNTARGFHSTVY